jgi:uncharacterized protein
VSVIIDRRLNDRNKSAVNRERFLRRYKEHIQRSVQDMVAERSIRDMERGGEVRIPVRDIDEPAFRHGEGGDREYVHTGNRKFMPGDRIERPQGGGGGRGRGQGGDGESEDAFAFSLSREEFMQIFFDDLELPRLARNVVGEVRQYKLQRAGYTTQGSPTNLAVGTAMNRATPGSRSCWPRSNCCAGGSTASRSSTRSTCATATAFRSPSRSARR